MPDGIELGFSSLDNEINIDSLPVQGSIPGWLSGTLIRNGAAKFELGGEGFRHWFDGLAMLKKFSFNQGNVSYMNRFLRSEAYIKGIKSGQIYYMEFATGPKSLAKITYLKMTRQLTDNASVNVVKVGGNYLAMTETPNRVAFDLETLDTLGRFKFIDNIQGQITTVHPHLDFKANEVINYMTKFSLACSYNIFRIKQGSKRRELISSIPVKEPAYMHSFAMTENYVLLVEFPLKISPLKVFMKSRAFVDNFIWQPDQGTRFLLINKQTGRLERSYRTGPFFAFHHINAFESNGEIVADMVVYPDASIINALYLSKLRSDLLEIPTPEVWRFRLPLDGNNLIETLISKKFVEFPRINYLAVNTRDYQFVYGVSSNMANGFNNELLKLDVKGKSTLVWSEENSFPGEPVFVARPNSVSEDDGVILSVVLNTKTAQSYLLVLEANSFAELARAEIPQAIPFGSHGQYFETND